MIKFNFLKNKIMKSKFLKIVITLLVVFGFAFIFLLFKAYFYIFPTCTYTEKEIKISDELSNLDLVLANDVYLINAKTEDLNNKMGVKLFMDQSYTENCNSNLYNVNLILESIEFKKYFEEYGFIENSSIKANILNKGKHFKIEKVFLVTKHGIGTIDSGPGPTVVLVLIDENNLEYKISTVYLPFKDDSFFKEREFNILFEYEVDGKRKILNTEDFSDLDNF